MWQTQKHNKIVRHIAPINTVPANAHIIIQSCRFGYNYVIQVIKIDSEVLTLWQVSHGLYIRDTSISSNRQRNGFPNNNSYYKTILTLHISQLSLNHGYLEISGNRIRNILHSITGSYTLLNEHTLLNITKNIAHTTLKQDKVSTQSLGTVYPF